MTTQPLRFGVFRHDDRDPRALFITWKDARKFADACQRDDPEGRYVIIQKVGIPPPGLGSVWTRCDTEGDIQ